MARRGDRRSEEGAAAGRESGERQLLTEKTIQTQLRRQVILNGLIYSEGESEERRDENIQKLEVLLRSNNQSAIERYALVPLAGLFLRRY
jgi:hypothetical protein